MTYMVYKTTSLLDGKSYVGFTSVGLDHRKAKHFENVRNGSSCYFHRAIRKYGKDAFVWKILGEYETEEEAEAAEIQMIREHNTLAPNGYNMTEGGDGVANPCLESRRKMSLASKNRWNDPSFQRLRSQCTQGENHPRSKLTASQAVEIYERSWRYDSVASLSREFGISVSACSDIKRRRTWKHIQPN